MTAGIAASRNMELGMAATTPVVRASDGPPRRCDHECRPMTRKQIIPTDRDRHRLSVTPASIQYLRTGGRRPRARKVGTVPGVRPFFE